MKVQKFVVYEVQTVVANAFKWNSKSNHQPSLQKWKLLPLLTTHACSVVWTCMYKSPSNIYCIILFLEACTHPMFCVIPPDLSCCNLHVLCQLLSSYHGKLSKHVACSVQLPEVYCYQSNVTSISVGWVQYPVIYTVLFFFFNFSYLNCCTVVSRKYVPTHA